MKKTLALLLAFSLSVLCSCGGASETVSEDSSVPNSSENLSEALSEADNSEDLSKETSEDVSVDSSEAESSEEASEETSEAVSEDVSEEIVYVRDDANLSVYRTGEIYAYKGEVENLYIPSTVNGIEIKEISRKAFIANMKLKNVYIEDGVKNIGEEAFKNCIKLESIRLPSTLETLWSGAISGTALTDIELPEGLWYIAFDAFAETQIRELVFPESAGIAGVFTDMKYLETVHFKGGDTIYSHTFNGCSSIREIHLPQTLSDIDDKAFEDLDSLQRIYVYKDSFAEYYILRYHPDFKLKLRYEEE